MNDNLKAQSVVKILDELLDLVENARGVPMSASVMVNRSEVTDLAQAARDAVPDQMVRADQLLASVEQTQAQAQERADSIVRDAQAKADQLVAEARERAARLTSGDAITIAARSEAQRINDAAREQADALREGANQYADSTLANLAERVSALGSQISDLNNHVLDVVDDSLRQIEGGRGVLAGRERSAAADATGQPSASEPAAAPAEPAGYPPVPPQPTASGEAPAPASAE